MDNLEKNERLLCTLPLPSQILNIEEFVCDGKSKYFLRSLDIKEIHAYLLFQEFQ